MIPNLDSLLDWLGPEGTKAGLQESKLTLKELVELAKERGFPLPSKPTREEVCNELAYAGAKKIDVPVEKLLGMDEVELAKYFKQARPSRFELTGVLGDLGIHIGSEARRSLYAFAAREMSDLGMYQRVARGKKQSSD